MSASKPARLRVFVADAVEHGPFDIGGQLDDAAGLQMSPENSQSTSVRFGRAPCGRPQLFAVASRAIGGIDALAESHRGRVQTQGLDDVVDGVVCKLCRLDGEFREFHLLGFGGLLGRGRAGGRFRRLIASRKPDRECTRNHQQVRRRGLSAVSG